jgi:hypothetical protein
MERNGKRRLELDRNSGILCGNVIIGDWLSKSKVVFSQD